MVRRGGFNPTQVLLLVMRVGCADLPTLKPGPRTSRRVEPSRSKRASVGLFFWGGWFFGGERRAVIEMNIVYEHVRVEKVEIGGFATGLGGGSAV